MPIKRTPVEGVAEHRRHMPDAESRDLRRWLADPQAYKPGTTMPKLPLSAEEIAELAAFLGQKKVQK